MQMPHKPLNLVPSGSKPPLCGKHFVEQLLKKVAKILLSVKLRNWMAHCVGKPYVGVMAQATSGPT